MTFKDYDPKLFKTKRLVCEITMEELASICHLTRQTLSNIESGRTINEATTILIGLALDGIAEEKGLVQVFEALEH